MIRVNDVVSSFCAVLFLTVASVAYQNKYCGLPCVFPNGLVPHTVCQRADQGCGPDPRCGPDFQVVHLTDDDRQYILDIHNYLRNKIAMGGEPSQPPAANMKAMSYNRELEYITQCWVNTCKGKTLQHDVCRRTSEYEYVGQNLGITGSTSISRLDLVKAIKQLILVWYNEVKSFDSSWIEETKMSAKMDIKSIHHELINFKSGFDDNEPTTDRFVITGNSAYSLYNPSQMIIYYRSAVRTGLAF